MAKVSMEKLIDQNSMFFEMKVVQMLARVGSNVARARWQVCSRE